MPVGKQDLLLFLKLSATFSSQAKTTINPCKLSLSLTHTGATASDKKYNASFHILVPRFAPSTAHLHLFLFLENPSTKYSILDLHH